MIFNRIFKMRSPRKPRSEKQKKARKKEYAKIKRKRRDIPNRKMTSIHVDSDLWEEFKEICGKQQGGFSASWHIWKWMRKYVRDERSRALREDYWKEIERRYGKTV